MHARRLPWRKRRVTPFQLLVAELLLKQTKAEDVARVWPVMLKRYATPSKLSKAPAADLRKLLRPLGFQRQRTAILKKVAGVLETRFGGQVPSRIDKLLDIPGVGLYTATAVACFAFSKRVPIVDANVLRVLSRFLGGQHPKDLRRAKVIWATAWRILPRQQPELHNYGILDFAAQVCKVKPICSNCPLRIKCRYVQSRQ
jgi:A/G-specific adenine glycosylase